MSAPGGEVLENAQRGPAPSQQPRAGPPHPSEATICGCRANGKLYSANARVVCMAPRCMTLGHTTQEQPSGEAQKEPLPSEPHS